MMYRKLLVNYELKKKENRYRCAYFEPRRIIKSIFSSELFFGLTSRGHISVTSACDLIFWLTILPLSNKILTTLAHQIK